MVDGVRGQTCPDIAVIKVLQGCTVSVIILLLLSEAIRALVTRRKKWIATSVWTIPIDVTKSVQTLLAVTHVSAAVATSMTLETRKSVSVRIFLLFLQPGSFDVAA